MLNPRVATPPPHRAWIFLNWDFCYMMPIQLLFCTGIPLHDSYVHLMLIFMFSFFINVPFVLPFFSYVVRFPSRVYVFFLLVSVPFSDSVPFLCFQFSVTVWFLCSVVRFPSRFHVFLFSISVPSPCFFRCPSHFHVLCSATIPFLCFF